MQCVNGVYDWAVLKRFTINDTQGLMVVNEKSWVLVLKSYFLVKMPCNGVPK